MRSVVRKRVFMFLRQHLFGREHRHLCDKQTSESPKNSLPSPGGGLEPIQVWPLPILRMCCYDSGTGMSQLWHRSQNRSVSQQDCVILIHKQTALAMIWCPCKSRDIAILRYDRSVEIVILQICLMLPFTSTVRETTPWVWNFTIPPQDFVWLLTWKHNIRKLFYVI